VAQGDTSREEVVVRRRPMALPCSAPGLAPVVNSAPEQAAVWLAVHHPVLRGALRDTLAQALGEVGLLDSGGDLEEGLCRRARGGESLPVVLAEWCLPGFSLARLGPWLGRRSGALSLLLCTDHAGADLRLHAHLLGVEAVVDAPFIVEHLHWVLRFLAQSQRRRFRMALTRGVSGQGALDGDVWSARS
jgi:hypothetical protein